MLCPFYQENHKNQNTVDKLQPNNEHELDPFVTNMRNSMNNVLETTNTAMKTLWAVFFKSKTIIAYPNISYNNIPMFPSA